MGSERRNCARRILYSPEYLDMGADNGGVVVDLSEGGLRFQAVGRIEPNSDVPLSFSLGTGYRIDVEGHVVWVNPRGNSGGIAFKKLSSDSRSLIREWLSKPEAEHRAEAAVSTADEEENDSLPAAPQAPLGEAAASEAQFAPPTIQGQPLASEALNDLPQEARVDEIAAPDVLAFHQHPVAPSAATVPPARAIRPAASSRPSANASPPVAPRASMKEPGMKNALPAGRTSVPSSTATAPFGPSFARSGREAQRSGASFSVVPSFSAWGEKDAPAPLIPDRPNPLKTSAPLFPPRNAENVFARGRWTAPQLEPESHAGRKAFFTLLILILVASALLFTAYEHGYRRQIGAIIQRADGIVAGQPGAAATTSGVGQSVNQPRNAATPLPHRAPATSPGTTSQPPDNAAAAGAPPRQISPPPPAQPSNSAANSALTPSNPGPVPASKSPAGPTSQTGLANGQPAQPPASTPAQTPVTLATPPDQSVSKQAAKNPASSSAASAASTANLRNFGQAEYLRAQRYLDGSGVTRDPAEAAEWFWRSLEAGNTNAALPLADLYLHGEGVSQSCIQARILLDAAVRKGNAEAARRLGQLPENCQ